jgi:hypothetical protein
MERSKLDKSTGPGWERIVTPLIAYCVAHGYKILQIKEKFGLLRFYYHNEDSKAYMGGDSNLDKLIEAATLEAAKTCEWCGAPGSRRKTGWVKTLCDTHEQEWNDGKRWWIDKDGKHV